MKNKYGICLSSGLIFLSIIGRPTQHNNPLDMAIQQIDTQSKELNQHIISTQQEGLASQKAQRLELQLATLQAEHEQETTELKKQCEILINSIKNELTLAQQDHATITATLKTITQELEEAKSQLTTQQTIITDLKATIASQAEQIKEYNLLKSQITQTNEKLKQSNALIPSTHL